MARILTETEVTATILTLLDDVAGGEEIEITRNGRVVARLVPVSAPHAGAPPTSTRPTPH